MGVVIRLNYNFPIYMVRILKKDKNINKYDIPVVAIGNAREILILCQKVLAPRLTLSEFFQIYKKQAEDRGINTKNLEINSFLKILALLDIIEIYEIPKEIFSNDG